MYKRNTAITGFTFCLVDASDGSAITSGTVTGYYTQNGGTQTSLTNTPVHEGNGEWSVTITAGEMNAAEIGLTFVHSSAIPVHFTIHTYTKLAEDLNDLSTSDVNTEVDTALSDIHLDHLLAADYDPASKPGVATALLNELVESDAGVSRFSANTLEQAPDTDYVGTGSGLSAIPWNSAWDSEVQSEVADALNVAVPGSPTADSINERIKTLDDNYTSTRAGYLDELGPSNMPSDLDDVLADTADIQPKLGTISDLGSGATVGANLVDIESQTDDIGVAGAGLSAIPWNASWDAQVESEVTDALNTYDPPTKTELDTGLAGLNDISTSEVNTEVAAALATYDPPTKAELDSGLAGLNDLSAAQVNAEVDQALVDIHLDHLLAVDYDPASKPGVATALLNELIENDGGVSRYTANALEQGPSGGGDGSNLTNIPWNSAWDTEVESEVTDALNTYDPPTMAELTSAVGSVSVSELQQSALADMFNTDSGDDYDTAAAGSVVKEIADNAGGSSLSEAGIADAVLEELVGDHESVEGSLADYVDDLVDRLGAFTGTGVNTVLGFLKALASKQASTPSDIGGTFAASTDSLEALREALSQTGVDQTVVGSLVQEYRGDTWDLSLSDLGSLTGYVTIDFTIKRSPDDLDADAVVCIRKNQSGSDDGLLIINGAAAGTPGNGSITVDDETDGDITVHLEASETDDLIPRSGLVYDVQLITASAVSTLRIAPFNILKDIRQAIT